MKRTNLFIIGITAAVVLLSACSPTAQAPDMAGTSWRLVSYGPNNAQTPVLEGVQTKLAFDLEGKVSGTFGCNSFGGDYSQDGYTLTFGPIMSTLMACDEALNKQESAGFAALQGEVQFIIDGDTLSIHTPDGNLLLYVRQ
jgi:heat shock protein HslJ